MAMNDMRTRLRDPPRHMLRAAQIAQPEMPGERVLGNAEGEVMSKRGQHFIGTRAASRTVHDQTDVMAASGLSARKIDNMAKQPAQRGAKDMQNVQRTRGRCLHASKPSLVDAQRIAGAQRIGERHAGAGGLPADGA